MNRKKDKRFMRDYSDKDILQYLIGLKKLLRRTPTFRDPKGIPGPSARTIVRRFGKWSIALKRAGIRPMTNQLMKSEGVYIQKNWKKMTDVEIARELGISRNVVNYYRQNYQLWKNRKLTARSTFRKKAISLYGKRCEVCNLEVVEWHHIISKSNDPDDWCILCPLCHSVITKKLVTVKSRNEIQTVLKPFIKNLYLSLKI